MTFIGAILISILNIEYEFKMSIQNLNSKMNNIFLDDFYPLDG